MTALARNSARVATAPAFLYNATTELQSQSIWRSFGSVFALRRGSCCCPASVWSKPRPLLRRVAKKRGARSEAGKETSGSDDSAETAFQRELRRRGLRPDGTKDPDFKGQRVATEEGRSGKPDAPPPFAKGKTPDQLEKSRLLNSEGLEGLLPRGAELLKLGTTFFLGLWPLVLTAIVLIGVTYAVFGSSFVHGGEKAQVQTAPKYVDPYELLAQDEIMRAYREGYLDR